MLDSTARAGDYLSNLVLFFMQFEFNEELGKHSVDPIQSDVGLSQLMLDIETVPDVPNCTIVLGNATEVSLTNATIVRGCTFCFVLMHRFKRCCISSSDAHP